MEKRRELRISLDEPVTVTILGHQEIRNKARFPARARNLSGRALALDMPNPAPIGAALKIQVADTILLGEVSYCQPRGESYLVGVELDQALNDIATLAETLQEFADAAGASSAAGSLQPEPVHVLEQADRQRRHRQHQKLRRLH